MSSSSAAGPVLARSPLPTMAEISRGGLLMLQRWAAEAGDWVDATDSFGPAIFLNDPAAVRAALRHPDAVLTGARGGPAKVIIGLGPLSSSGPGWQYQRRMLAGTFRDETIREWLPELIAVVRERAATWRNSGSPIDLARESSRLAQDMMGRVILGDAAGVAGFAAELAYALDQTAPEVIEEAETGNIFAPLMTMLKSADAIHAMVRAAVAAGRLDAGRWPHTTAARCLGDRTELDEADIHLLTTLMVVSVLTLGPVIFWTLHHLSEKPEWWHQARAEADALFAATVDADAVLTQLPAVRGALFEAIRLYPPYWIVSKTAQTATQVAGIDIEAESRVHLIPWLTQRDARWFPEPEQFDPGRWSNGVEPHALGAAFLPFLMGQRVCPARGLALPEALGAVAAVISGAGSFSPAAGGPPLPVVHSLALRVPATYEVRFADAGQ